MKDRLKKLGDVPLKILDGDRGVNYPNKSEFQKTGFCLFLNTSNVTKTGFDFSNTDFVSQERDALLRKGRLCRGDIVMTTRGTIGNVAYFADDVVYEHVRINSGMVILRAEATKLDPYFLYSFLRSDLFKQQTRSQGSGSAQPQLPIGSLKNIVIPHLDLPDQREIGQLVSILDSRIGINSQINDELENMAKLLYDYWFVQFDFPITAAQAAAMGNPRLEGKPYRASGGKMVYDHTLKRDIPETWDVCALSRIARTGSGGTPASTKREYYEGGEITWINSGEVNLPYIVSGANFITQAGLDNSSAKLLPSRTLLIALYGATAGKVSILLTEACLNQAVCGILPNDPTMLFYLKFFLSHLYDHLVLMSSGSARDNLSQDLVRNINVIVPPFDVLERFHETVDAGVAIIANNMRQNEELSALRDWLLPMLMNGQVTVT